MSVINLRRIRKRLWNIQSNKKKRQLFVRLIIRKHFQNQYTFIVQRTHRNIFFKFEEILAFDCINV